MSCKSALLLVSLGLATASVGQSSISSSASNPLGFLSLRLGRKIRSVPTPVRDDFIAGQLLIKLKPSGNQPGQDPVVSSLPAGSKFHNSLYHMGWTLWTIPSNSDPRLVAKQAMKDPHVAYAEPVYRVHILLGAPNDYDYNVQETDPEVVLDFYDEGISFTRLWHLDDDDAVTAWSDYPGQFYTAATKPSNTPTIAIIDSGCDSTHPDFINAGGASTDSALGGQLDYSTSAHFSFGVPDGAPWDDENGHGTHVTGLALASANNGGFDGHGVIGIGYNAKGMILKVIDGGGSGSDTDAAGAIFYAVDHGADVINLSLGTPNYSQIFQDATSYAWQKGSLVVAAGNENGNGGGNLGPIYPAACSGALAVEANGPDYAPATATYSGYGNYVDIAAPGGDLVQSSDYYLVQYIFSTAMQTPGGLYDISYPNGNLYPPYHLDYAYLAGTSMACPQVAGAAALYYGKYALRQSQGHVNIRAYRALERTAFGAMGAPNGGWEPYQGYGCLYASTLLQDGNPRSATIGSIEGIVYDGGTPISNVQVRAQNVNGGIYYSTTTLADGTYRFDGMPGGTYNVSAAPFGHLRTKQSLVLVGSDATGVDFWVDGNPYDSTPPVVPIFSVNSFNSSSVSISQWGYDPESSIDSVKIRIGTTSGGQDVYPDTALVTEATNVTLTGFTLTQNSTYYLRATYTDGAGLTTTVDRQFTYGSATVTGSIILQNYSGAMPPVTIDVRQPGSTTAIHTYVVTPAANGSFAIPAPGAGTYDFAFKASHWLRKVLHNVGVSANGASGLAPSLINGDVNGDNAVTLGDFAALRSAYNSTSGSGNWNANADLNGDGSVTLADFGIFRTNYNRTGDP